MKHLFLSALALLLAFTASGQSEQPILTLHTSAYEQYGASNAFHLTIGLKTDGYLDVDCGFGLMEVEAGQAVYVDSLQSIQGTAIPCTVSAKGEVKIYGDASQIDYFSAEGCYLTDIDLSQLTALEILDLGHNELRGLDLTPQTRLQALYLDDNPMTETGLTLGTPKANLQILEMGRIAKLNAFNLSDYPAMVSFDAWGNTALHSLDPTGCPHLQKISIDSCPVESLDVSQNPLLQILNVSDSGVDSLDLSHNANLLQLYAAHTSDFLYTDHKFRTLDLSATPNLIYLYCGGNRLRQLDITGLHYLQTLGCQENYLTELDITQNVNLLSVSLQNNYFGFCALPLPSDDWSEYYYYQRPMPVAKCVAAGTPIDFTNQVKEGTTTTITVSRRNAEQSDGATELIADTDYTWRDGYLTVLTPQSDSLQVAFANDAFTEYTLWSEWFMVKSADEVGQPSRLASFTAEAKQGDSIVYEVNGERQALMAATDNPTIDVMMPEGTTLESLAIRDVPLTAVDLSRADRLSRLTLTGTGLTALDLRANRALRMLRLAGNQLGDFSLAGYDGSYEKTQLDTLILTSDGLTSLTFIEPMALRYVDLSHNQLTSLAAATNMDNVTELNIEDNHIAQLNLLNCAAMRTLKAADNDLTQIQQPEKPALQSVNIAGNRYTLATVPDFPTTPYYIYAPQQPIKISAKGPGVNLSAQVVERDGQTTHFEWVKEDGTVLVPGTDYTLENGVTRFVNTSAGRVVCRMTHDAYPQFAAAPLTTTAIETAPMPTHVLASFRTYGDSIALTARATRPEQSLYVDWTGLQADLDELALSDQTYTDFQAQTTSGALVKVYTYADDDPVSVFGLYGARLSEVDLSELTHLTTLSLTGASLTPADITFPASRETIGELNLSGNKFSGIDLTQFPALYMLNLSGNQFTALDLSKAPLLTTASASHNALREITFGNPSLWSLDLAYNELDSVSFQGAEALEQVALFDNKLTGLDVTALKSLRYLDVSNNRMTIATLPLLDESRVIYTYNNQAPLTVECVDGQVNLVSQAARNGLRTTYQWFVGAPSLDEDGNLVGEELVLDEEYTVKGGITTFLTDPGDDVMCVMTNATFPRLYLLTNLVRCVPAGIQNSQFIIKNGEAYDLQGRRVAHPTKGIYVVGGRKVMY